VAKYINRYYFVQYAGFQGRVYVGCKTT